MLSLERSKTVFDNYYALQNFSDKIRSDANALQNFRGSHAWNIKSFPELISIAVKLFYIEQLPESTPHNDVCQIWLRHNRTCHFQYLVLKKPDKGIINL